MNQVIHQSFENNEKGLNLLFNKDKLEKNPTKAQSFFSKSILLHPKEPIFYWHKAESFLESGELTCSIIFFKIAIQKIREFNSTENEGFLDKIQVKIKSEKDNLYLNMRYEKIRRSFKKFSVCLRHELEPTFCADPNASRELNFLKVNFYYNHRAFANIGLKNYEDAIENICLVVLHCPNYLNAIILRARLYMRLEKFDFVNIDLERIVELDSKHFVIKELRDFVIRVAVNYKNIASHMMLKGNVGMAIFYLSHAIELDKNDWTLYFKRGVLFSELGQFDSSIIDLRKALDDISAKKLDGTLEITPEREQNVWDHLGSVYNQMGIICFKKKKYEDAVYNFTGGIKCNPCITTLYKNRADCFYNLNEIKLALKDLNQVLSIEDEDQETKTKLATYNFILGEEFFSTGDYIKCIEKYNLAVKLNGSETKYFFERARCHHIMENIEECIADLKQVLKLHPNNVDAVGMLNRLIGGKPLDNILPFPPQKVLKKIEEKQENLITFPSISLLGVNRVKKSKEKS
ncbi:Tetratricopeptide repeat protein 16 [Clydaea vesicula]|uniref:Tetratricopeptide repeat protein 16 n=1 Tax=Clydaea vesicula TaxID=447962 RepID=A0AAD5XWU4_9FUNG|nr:Tetratricopeptide repeat protein 16 [Clydaea vesicula]